MLTLPIEAATDIHQETRVLIIGRSENVLSETVRTLRLIGYAAGASNDFAGVMDLFDMTAVDLVIFGGMVPPDTKEQLRRQISDRNAAVAFVQGFAGIPGVIVAQVRGARTGDANAQTGLAVAYDPATRTVDLRLDQAEDVQVVAWWGTSFTPPEPRSTSQVLVDARLRRRPRRDASRGSPRAGVIRHRRGRGRGANAHRRPHARGPDHGGPPWLAGTHGGLSTDLAGLEVKSGE